MRVYLTVLISFFFVAQVAIAGKPRVHILATGGTIAGAQTDKSAYGYKSGAFSVDDLIAAVPQMKDIAE